MKNTQIILAKRPVGVPGPEHFARREVDVGTPAEGQVLVRITHWSVDPAMRGWANDVPNYAPPVALGDPMRAFAVGDVLASKHPAYAEGDVVEGLLGWQTHALVEGAAIARKVTETDLPRTYALGILGLNGTTALFRSLGKLRGQGRRHGCRIFRRWGGRVCGGPRSRRCWVAARWGSPEGQRRNGSALRNSALTSPSTTRPRTWPKRSRPSARTGWIATSTIPAGRSRTP